MDGENLGVAPGRGCNPENGGGQPLCPRVMIEKFATILGPRSSEFLDLNHTRKSTLLVPL